MVQETRDIYKTKEDKAAEETNQDRRHALAAIAKFSAYVAPMTYVLLDAESARADQPSCARQDPPTCGGPKPPK